jgi:23S rRNA (uracil1939-C5)-methyltransferase
VKTRKPTAKDLELRTTSMAPSGEAVAHFEDEKGERRAVLVRGGTSGELVRARADVSERPARADIVEILEPSAWRVDPICKWASECGGCDWMHIARDEQAAHHVALTKDFARDAPVAFHRSPRDARYRTRARFHASGGAHRQSARMQVGYFAPRTRSLVRVETCVILDPRVDAARGALEGLLEGAQGDGEIAVAVGRDGPVADIRWSRELPPAVFARIDDSVRSKRFAGLRVLCGEARRPAIFGDPTPVLVGADDLPLELPPGGFSQAQEDVNRALALRVADLTRGSKRILELYAGAGNLTVLLARDGDVRAVESSEPACEAARKNLAARKLAAKVTCADAATFEIPSITDTVVLDPPRTGAREACERISKTRSVKRIVYVSCDRPTLARDLDVLAPTNDGAFAVTSVDVFEMFPQTSHAETVVFLERKKMKPA